MAEPPNYIDLTGGDDDDTETSAPAVNGSQHHGRPAHPNTGDDGRPAKRVKLTQPEAQPFSRLSEPLRHFAGECIDEGARESPWLDRTNLERKVCTIPTKSPGGAKRGEKEQQKG